LKTCVLTILSGKGIGFCFALGYLKARLIEIRILYQNEAQDRDENLQNI